MGTALRTPNGQYKIYKYSKTIFETNTTFKLTFDAKNIPGYQNLTTENFYIAEIGLNPKSTTNAGFLTRSYDSSSGILTVSLSTGTSISMYSKIEIVCIV